MAYVTVIHRDPPFDPKKAKSISSIPKLVRGNDIRVVSFIFAYDGFYDRADEKTIATLDNYRTLVSDFIKENNLIDRVKGVLFSVDGNPVFDVYVVGFKHTALSKLMNR